MTKKQTFLIIFSLLALSACSNSVKQKMGLTRTAPDEYQVDRGQHLEVPPHYELKEPADYQKPKNVKKEKVKKAKKWGLFSKSESALIEEIEQDKK